CAVTIIPDIRQMEAHPVAPYYLDLKYSATDIHVVYGLSHYSVVRHQYYERKPAAFPLQERLRLAFYVLVTPGTEALDVLKNTNAFLWSNFAAPYRKSILPQTVPFQRYAAVAYPMALDNYWVDGPVKEQGGITLSTFYDSATKRYGGRSGPNDLWYHSWFNNART